MKKFFFLACAALTLAACSDDDENPTPDPDPAPTVSVISFENAEALKGVDGKDVVLADAVVESTFGLGGTWPEVYWFEHVTNYESFMKDDEWSGKFYDGELFSAADGNARFGTNYSSSSYGDSWGGFSLSGNFTQTAPESGYPQFSVWAAGGANGTKRCAVGYNSAYDGGPVYALPTIEFDEAVTMRYCYLANTAVTYTYQPTAVEASDYYYKVTVEGSLKGVATGSAECTLVSGGKPVADWVKVDLTTLGEVDKVVFAVDSNERNAQGLLVPAFFGLDEIGYIAEK